MARFCLGVIFGCAFVAAAALVGGHIVLELADGNLAHF